MLPEPSSNFTLPNGTTNHGDPKLICVPAAWHDILVFFGANYFAHAVTVLSMPGQSLQETVVVVLICLILPSSALTRSYRAIMLCAGLKKNELEKATRSCALCMVRKKEPPENGGSKSSGLEKTDTIEEIVPVGDQLEDRIPAQSQLPIKSETKKIAMEILPFKDGSSNRDIEKAPPQAEEISWNDVGWKKIDPKAVTIYGSYRLPDGYIIASVAPETRLRFKDPSSAAIRLSYDYSVSKAAISFLQGAWSSIVLYKTRGDQIDRYGFAAFGLTVAPYAVMSTVNLLANLVTPTYPAMFMIRTPAMEEAEHEGGFFEGHIGDVELVTDPRSGRARSIAQYLWKGDLDNRHSSSLLKGVLFLSPIAIVGGLSGFKKGQSTAVQQGFTMAWLACGIIMVIDLTSRPSLSLLRIFGDTEALSTGTYTGAIFGILLFAILYATPAVGSMVIVAKMVREYGVCSLLP